MLTFPMSKEIRFYDSEPDGTDLNSSGVKTNLNVEANRTRRQEDKRVVRAKRGGDQVVYGRAKAKEARLRERRGINLV